MRRWVFLQSSTTAAFSLCSRGSAAKTPWSPRTYAFLSSARARVLWVCHPGGKSVSDLGRQLSPQPANHRKFSSSIEEMGELDQWDSVLPFESHTHNSVKVVIPGDTDVNNGEQKSPFEPETFRQRLDATVATCRELHKSAIWVEVPMSRASLIEQMDEFRFHNADGACANLFLWLKDIECKIPSYATHQVGVGAIVVNSREEILCVRELKRNFFRWKIPGGLSELGEHLDDAAIREVKEETGVKCRFKGVISVRHTHGMQFGRSDLYFVCHLEPIEEKDEKTGKPLIPDPVPEEGEIEKAAWVSLREYKEMINAPDGHPMMKHIMQLYDQDRSLERTVLSSIVPGRKPSPIYHAPLHRILSPDRKQRVGEEGEHDKFKLLAGMEPVLDSAPYVFATTNTPEKYSNLTAIMRFSEDEGETLILTEKDAIDAGLARSARYKRITLTVHSALDAVGFLTAVCTPLTTAGISTNAVAGYFHDHIFVPEEKAEEALQILEQLSRSAQQNEEI